MESTRNKEEDRFAHANKMCRLFGFQDTPAERRLRDEKLNERLTDLKTEMNGVL